MPGQALIGQIVTPQIERHLLGINCLFMIFFLSSNCFCLHIFIDLFARTPGFLKAVCFDLKYLGITESPGNSNKFSTSIYFGIKQPTLEIDNHGPIWNFE